MRSRSEEVGEQAVDTAEVGCCLLDLVGCFFTFLLFVLVVGSVLLKEHPASKLGLMGRLSDRSGVLVPTLSNIVRLGSNRG